MCVQLDDENQIEAIQLISNKQMALNDDFRINCNVSNATLTFVNMCLWSWCAIGAVLLRYVR